MRRSEMYDFVSEQGKVNSAKNFIFHKIWGIS
jgi:hypothetical protein